MIRMQRKSKDILQIRSAIDALRRAMPPTVSMYSLLVERRLPGPARDIVAADALFVVNVALTMDGVFFVSCWSENWMWSTRRMGLSCR